MPMPQLRLHPFCCALLCLIEAFAGRIGYAQPPHGQVDSVAWCNNAIARLTRDGFHAYPLIAGDIVACGHPMAAAVASALRQSQHATRADSETLTSLMAISQQLQSPVLLDAAEAIARDRTASSLARVTGLYILGAYFGPLWTATPWIGTAAQCIKSPCVSVHSVVCHWPVERHVEPLPADSNQRIVAIMDAVRNDTSAQFAVRDVAGQFHQTMQRWIDHPPRVSDFEVKIPSKAP